MKPYLLALVLLIPLSQPRTIVVDPPIPPPTVIEAGLLPQVSPIPPILQRIMACESTGNPNGTPRQFLPNGSELWGNDPITGKPIHRDLGIAQINTYVWGSLAKQMGDDLYTEQGNLDFALYLYAKYGTSPWLASEGCWD